MARRLAAILVADVVGYSRLMAADEAGTHARLKALRKDLIEPKIAEHRGRMVKLTGDGALVEFQSVLDAVACAVEVQRGMAERNAKIAPDDQISFRVGVNLGDVIFDDDDIYGDGVNVAARLEGLAEPGGVCISGKVHEEVKNKLGFGYQDLGPQTVKNIPEPVRAYRVLTEPGAIGAVVGQLTAAVGGKRRAAWQMLAMGAVVALVVIGVGVVGWLRPWESTGEMEGVTLDPRRVAVLPFANISADAADEYFSDGITEEMITRLSKIPELSVIARTSIIGYKGSSKGVAEIGRELGVGTVLEGSVRRAGDQVRITAQLIDARSQAHLWAENYDRQTGRRLRCPERRRAAGGQGFADRAVPRREAARRAPGTKDPVAHDLYLKARRNYYENTAQGMEQAIAGYAAATQRDPSYAMAYVGLATAWIDAFWLLPVTPREALANAKAAAEHALALDEDLAEAHAALAYAKFYTWDWPGAEAGFKRAIELNPNSAWAIDGYNWGYLTQIRGRYDEALVGVRRAVELDPLNSSILNDLGFVLYHAGRYDAAIEQFQQSAEMVPDNIYGYMGLGTTYLALRRFDEAVRWFEKAVEVGGGDLMAKAHLGWAYGRAAEDQGGAGDRR